MADLGYIFLLLALVVSGYAVMAAAMGARTRHPELVASARNAAFAVAGLVSLAALALFYLILSHDFRVEYVAAYTSRDMSLSYLLSAFWAGNKGSLLLWGWLLSLFVFVLLLQNRRRHQELMPYVISITMVIETFFLLLMTFVSNPFEKLPFIPAEGRGLNPLLENPGMLFHPPTLFLGYVGFAIPFAFAMAALITRRLGDEWIRATRRWTLFAWFFLGVGNLLGAWWAYVELGWGGYWAWDPVENASFMPWLVATAFLHSVMIQRRRGMLKVWNMVLIILVFELTIFGTFLVRSGILSSVHTFAESGLGPFFLWFMGLTLFASLALLLYRRRELRGEEELDSLVSRESSFLLNNLILVGAAFAIFWGTVFPVISEWVRGAKITVGPPFFNQVVGPILLALILLMGLCPLIGWRRASLNNLLRNFLYPLIAPALLVVILLALGVRGGYAITGFTLCGFVGATILFEWFRGARARARHLPRPGNALFLPLGWARAFFGLLWANKPRYGGYIVHLSILFIAVGVIGSSFYGKEAEAVLVPDESLSIDKYTLTYEDLAEYVTESRIVTTATLSVYNRGRFAGIVTPEKYLHRSYQQPVTEVAIRSTLGEDLYVILGEVDQEGRAYFKVLLNPLVSWIWIGGGVLLLGTVTAFWPDRLERETSGRLRRRV